MNRNIVHKPGSIQDGLLDRYCGRIVIHNGAILISNGPSADHNYLLRAIASRYRFSQSDVIHNAIRLYYRRESNRILICGCRRIDDDALDFKTLQVIASNLK